LIPSQATPPVRDLVLVGGGHAHVGVLRQFAMHRLDGVRVTVIAREVDTPYSGMLPGYVAGHYGYDDIHIDLGPLTLAAGARLIAADACGLDLRAGRVELADRPPLRFDVVSLNCGAAPGLDATPLPASAIPVKPIGQFLPRWHALLAVLRERDAAATAVELVVVGAGPGGVELALAVHHAVAMLPAAVRITVVTDMDDVLVGHNRSVRRRFQRLLQARGVELVTGFRVARLDGRSITAQDGRTRPADRVLLVTGVAAPTWLRQTGLDLDADGFVVVDARLRSASDPRVFAAGDVAALHGQTRPKSGVFAVREGPILADNLRRALLGRPLRRYHAQRRFLALISEGKRSATASRGALFAYGYWMWRWKNWIDRRFITRFQRIARMPARAPVIAPAFADDVPDPMRCGGCGAKLGADVLAETFARLTVAAHPRIALGIGDDAALLEVADRRVAITVDGLRRMLDDPYEFGRICVRHALNDVFAMGAEPVTALALVSVPLMGAALMRDELFQVMSGVLSVLTEEGVALSGGHSNEGLELTLGLTVIGDVTAEPLRKTALAVGDALVLTRALGSGILLAAQARGVSRTRWLRAALDVMDTSNRSAVAILRAHGARACTDVSGFGLLGHLAEMLAGAGAGAELDATAVPLLEGALVMAHDGVASSLQPANAQILDRFARDGVAADDARLALLVDPQTAGGLLAGVPADAAEACIAALRRAGHRDAGVVGRVVAARDDLGVIRG
jgi:selenide, water dikinase